MYCIVLSLCNSYLNGLHFCVNLLGRVLGLMIYLNLKLIDKKNILNLRDLF
jgi:hypothetical protein